MDGSAMENGDDSLLRWRVSLEESDGCMVEEEFGGEPLLKTMVRTNYLYHLRQNLRKNLEAQKQNSNLSIEEHNINKIVKGCGTLLEEKAMRNCMIARLYQRMMSSIIKEVKKATNESILYLPLKDFAERQNATFSSPPRNEEIQTDVTMEFLSNLFADIENRSQSLLRNKSCSNAVTFPSVDAHPKHANSINGIPKNWCVKCNRETFGSLCNHSSLNSQRRNASWQQKTDYTSDIPDLNGIFETGVHVQQRSTTHPNVNDASQSYSSDKNDEFQLKLRSPNFVEGVAYWHHLETEIEDLPLAKRRKLDQHFVRLFGDDHARDYYNLTNEQKSITCRKRIAKYVVIELTSYYNKGMIASKQLFKTMAKYITSLLLGRSLYPNPEEIKKCVDEFFQDDRIIKTETDFYV